MNRRKVYERIDSTFHDGLNIFAITTMFGGASIYVLARLSGNEEIADVARLPTFIATAYVLGASSEGNRYKER